MVKNRFLILIFLGIAGMTFYANFIGVESIHFSFLYLISLVSIFSLHYGYRAIEKKYEKKNSRKLRWTIAFSGMFIILISLMVTFLYEPFIGFGAGLVFTSILILSIKKYLDSKNTTLNKKV